MSTIDEIKVFLKERGYTIIENVDIDSPIKLIGIRSAHIYLLRIKEGRLSLSEKLKLEGEMPKSDERYVTSLVLDDNWKTWLGD